MLAIRNRIRRRLTACLRDAVAVGLWLAVRSAAKFGQQVPSFDTHSMVDNVQAFTADAIANEFLRNYKQHRITPMKLQKLVYYAHAWFLALYDRPLISEPIYAWRYGPVVQSLWHEFKRIGDQPIDRLAIEIKWHDDSADESATEISVIEPSIDDDTFAGLDAGLARDHIEEVWKVLGKYSAIQLSNMTHEPNEPWRKVYDKFGGAIPKGIAIPNDLISECFKKIHRERTKA